MEEGERSNASSSCGGGGDGGRSCPMSTREVLSDNLRAALEASEEKHVAIRGCDQKWPFDLTYRKRSGSSPEASNAARRLSDSTSRVDMGQLRPPSPPPPHEELALLLSPSSIAPAVNRKDFKLKNCQAFC
jgi:hypothetical protein